MKIYCACRHFGTVIVLLIILLGNLPLEVARADLGLPFINPGGSSLDLPEGERTNVRMVEEEVNLTIETLEQAIPASGGYRMRGKVEAVFLMRNLGTETEALEVWFPLQTSVRYEGGLFNYPDQVVQDFKIWVDGAQKPVQRIKAPDLEDPTQESAWASFPITFPAGKDVVVQVTYSLYPSGYGTFGSFEYILQTGADWNGTIGKALIQVNLPYPVTKETVSLSGKSIDGQPLAPQPSGYVIDNNIIRWEFSELEPTSQDNIAVDVLEPYRYQNLIAARNRAASQPDSAEAQFGLAKATWGAIRVVKYVNQNGAGPELAEQVNVAFRRALELAPDREDFMVADIDWLMQSEGWVSLMSDGTCPAEACELLERAVQLFPKNTYLLDLEAGIQSQQADWAYRYQVATEEAATASVETQQVIDVASTATALAEADRPTLMPSPASTATQVAPTITSQPTVVPAAFNPALSPTPETTSIPQPASQNPGSSIGLIAFGLPLVLVVVVVFAYRFGWLFRRR